MLIAELPDRLHSQRLCAEATCIYLSRCALLCLLFHAVLRGVWSISTASSPGSVHRHHQQCGVRMEEGSPIDPKVPRRTTVFPLRLQPY